MQGSGSSQFFRDAWAGTSPVEPECDDTGYPDGADYNSCYSGWYTAQ